MSDTVHDIHKPKLLNDDQIIAIYERQWKQPEDRNHNEILDYIFDYPDGDMSDADAMLNHINAQDEVIARLRKASTEMRDAFRALWDKDAALEDSHMPRPTYELVGEWADAIDAYEELEAVLGTDN